ncbi:MAG: hypothetical protein Q9213_002333 [Squamulea squamosa]
MPGFVTTEGALEPFKLNTKHGAEFANATWKAQTTLYGTSLNCDPAETRNQSSRLSYSNGKNCTIESGYSPIDSDFTHFGSLYIGYPYDQYVDYSLSGLGCPAPVNSHLFLGLWGESIGAGRGSKISAIFCEPSYWVQEVEAAVTNPGMNVTEVVPTGPQVHLTDQKFNRTAFEYDIGTGAQAVSRRADVSETISIIDQKAHLERLGLNGTTTNMVGFALGLSKPNLTELIDPNKLAASFETAHKLLHALAIMQLMDSTVIDVRSRPGIISGKVNAIIVVRPLAIAVEVLLGLVVVLVLTLTLYSASRASQLHRDPTSLTDIIALLSMEHQNHGSRHKAPNTTDTIRYRLVKGKILVASPTDVSSIPCCGARSGHPSKDSNLSTSSRRQGNHGLMTTSSLVRPFAMGLPIGSVFIAVLLTALATVLALEFYADKHNGLSIPSNSTILNQIILKYVLILLATLIEPFWLLLNRQLCVLQPFKELHGANAPASKSLDLKYTSLPPQMNVWRAFRGHHYVLSLVCAIGLSANLLAVSLSGLLQIDPVKSEVARPLAQTYRPSYGGTPSLRNLWHHQYVAKANISDGIALPPWTAPDRFFVPFDVGSGLGTASVVRASTQGFGISAKCERSDANDTALVNG